MRATIIAFDQFTDIDVFLIWDLLKRVKVPNWEVQILGDKSNHMSLGGLVIPTHGELARANDADVVIFTSGPGSRKKLEDSAFLGAFKLSPERQMIGSMCSGALILAKLGLLKGREATTYPTAKAALEAFGVTVVEKPFVAEGNVATAAGCLAAQYLAGWVIERHAGPAIRQAVLKSIQPVGEGLSFSSADLEAVNKVYAPKPPGGPAPVLR